MSYQTTKYPKSYWDDSIIEYIGLKKGNAYYKNYVATCLLNKMKQNGRYSYGRYELEEDLMEIFRNKLNTNYMWRWTSKSGINNVLSYFRHSNYNTVNSSHVYVIDFNEDGGNVHEISI